MEFIKAQDAIALLGKYNELIFDSDEAKALLKNQVTTEDIKVNCQDLKVLGKRDFKTLLKWRTTIREEVYFKPHEHGSAYRCVCVVQDGPQGGRKGGDGGGGNRTDR